MSIDHPDRAWLETVSQAIAAWLTGSGADGPTSQITGHGAFRAVERRLNQLHADRPALLLPSNSYGMRAILEALGVGPGDTVLVPEVDWPSNWAAVRSLSAIPVPVAVDPATVTISPKAAAAARLPSTRAAIVTHLHSIMADVPALIAALPGLPIIEDCAQALGSQLDGFPAGTLGTAGVLSFGPTKQLDAGELGAVVCQSPELLRNLVERACHPVRQTMSGVASPSPARFAVRPNPLAPVVLHYLLSTWDANARHSAHDALARELQTMGFEIIGSDARRRSAAQAVPIHARVGVLDVLSDFVVTPSPAWRVDADGNWRPDPGDVWLVRRCAAAQTNPPGAR